MEKISLDYIIIYNKNKDALMDMKDRVNEEIGLVNRKSLNFRLFSNMESLLTFVWLDFENCPYMILDDPAKDQKEAKLLLEYLARKYGMTHMIYLTDHEQKKQDCSVANQKSGRKQPVTILQRTELPDFLKRKKESMGEWFQYVSQTNHQDQLDRKKDDEDGYLIL